MKNPLTRCRRNEETLNRYAIWLRKSSRCATTRRAVPTIPGWPAGCLAMSYFVHYPRFGKIQQSGIAEPYSSQSSVQNWAAYHYDNFPHRQIQTPSVSYPRWEDLTSTPCSDILGIRWHPRAVHPRLLHQKYQS